MSKFNRILLLVFFVLLTVIIIEIGYIIVTRLSKKQIISNTSTKPILKEDFKSAIHPDRIKYLSSFVNNTKTKAYLTIESKGVVTEIDLKGKQVESKLFPFGLKILSGEVDYWLLVSKTTLYNLLEVYVVDKNGIKKTDISEIKIGDNILTQQIIDLAYPTFDPRSAKSLIIKILK